MLRSDSPPDARGDAPPGGAVLFGASTVLLTIGALVTYKASAALATIAKAERSGTLRPKAEWLATANLHGLLKTLAGTINYFSWVLVALSFGVIIGAMVKALIPDRWLLRTIAARGVRGHVAAALAGTPLMLCSCCVAPVFEGVYERTGRLGPALGLMFAAPALNPATIALTFLLLPHRLAWARLVLSVLLVLLVSAGLGMAFGQRLRPAACPVDFSRPGPGALLRGFLASLRQVAARSLPAIGIGVLASVALTGLVPLGPQAGLQGGLIMAPVLIAAIAVPIALPTFGEIPIALALVQAGASAGMVLPLLVAGPAINLPSLLTLRKIVSYRAALATGISVFAVAALGGILMGVLAW